jgi:hypothetical protein
LYPASATVSQSKRAVLLRLTELAFEERIAAVKKVGSGMKLSL